MANEQLPEIALDSNDLYLEEVFTDRRVGSLRRLTPVTKDGSPDPKRQTLFLGQAQLLTQMGALPINFEVEANSLEEAIAKFPDAAREGLEHTVEEIQEMRREAASSIVIPEPGAGGALGGGAGRGKIQLR
jgi:hypothetical protein